MYLNTLENRNLALIEYAFNNREKFYPNTYILDMDTIEENAKMMLCEAQKYNIDLFFMTKQLGRNPIVCKKLTDMGYAGAVVVDFQEALVMMEHNIPIAHLGHLVQTPTSLLEKILQYGVGIVTVFSIEKAEEISRIAKKLDITQEICLKFYAKDDFVYAGQEGGFPLEDAEYVMNKLKTLDNIKVSTLTSFPCFLYDSEKEQPLPLSNINTLKKAKAIGESILGHSLKLNLPSCSQSSLMADVSAHGGNSAEPGSSLSGMTPNNVSGNALEVPAMVYFSEVSHNHENNAYCFGGGTYFRGDIDCALVGESYSTAKKIKAQQPCEKNIDYYIRLKEEANVGDTALMLFRTQIFITRSMVAVVSGLRKGSPKIEGLYTSTGQEMSL